MTTKVEIPKIVTYASYKSEPWPPDGEEWRRHYDRYEHVDTATVEVTEPSFTSCWLSVRIPGVGEFKLILGTDDRNELIRQLATLKESK